MRAQLITIGDELLLGQTTNTNATWLGERLSGLGVQVQRVVTIRDSSDAIQRELDRAFQWSPLVVVTGGLGPTHDDLTREAVAEYVGVPLQTNTEVLGRLRRYYELRGRQMPEEAASLAEIPSGFEILENPVGAAVGLWYHDGDRLLAVLPGIPDEMKGIFREAVRPRLQARSDLRDVIHRTLVTAGIGESALQEELGDLSDVLDVDTHLAYLPSTSGVRLRLTATAAGDGRADERLDRVETGIRERVGNHIIGTGEESLERVLAESLTDRGLSIASAESATGGLIGHRLTAISGSSDYFTGGIVAYANRVKTDVLCVDADDIEIHGAVSEEVALQMAEGVRDVLSTDIGVSTTGIAGPKGGTAEKPVGTVWLGYADQDGSRAVRRQFVEDRTLNKELFSTSALDLVRRSLRRGTRPVEE